MLCWSVTLKRELVNPRSGLAHCAAVPVGDNVYCFAGLPPCEAGDEDQIDVHVFNTVSSHWKKLSPVTNGKGERPLEVPSPRWGHTAVVIEDFIYIWGGTVKFEMMENSFKITGHTQDNVLYAFNVNTHKWLKLEVSGTVPVGREGHSACGLGKVMYIRGGKTHSVHRYPSGQSNQSYINNKMYKFDTSTMVWTLINTEGISTFGFCCHSLTIIGTKMYCVFRGKDFQPEQSNNMFVFDTETNCWLSTPSARLLPEGHGCHAAFAYNGELYIYYNLGLNLNDLWKFNPETFFWKKVEPKGKGLDWKCGMFSCMVRDRIFLFESTAQAQQPVSCCFQAFDLSPSLKTLSKLAVIQYGLEQSGLPHNIRWELEGHDTTK